MSLSRNDLDERGEKTLWVSWSRLLDYTKCQQRAKLHMAGKGDTIKDGRRFIHGTLADRAMRMWLEQDTEHLPGQMAEYVDLVWEEHAVNSTEYKINWKGDPVEDQKAVRDLAKRVVTNVEPFLFARVLPFEFEPEFRFQVPVKIPDSYGMARTVVLNGGMDIAVRESESKIALYDLKATTNEKYVEGAIMPQLIFYSIAWSLMFGPPEEMLAAFLTPACKVQYHPLNITAEDRRHLMTRIISFAQSVWDQSEPECSGYPSECFWCDVKKHCPMFATVPVIGGNGNKVSLSTTAKNRKAAKDAQRGE